MKELISSIEHITRSKSCVVVFRRYGRHLFGGRPAIKMSGIKPPAPIHHLFTLDTYDSLSPIQFDGVRFIPLIYPLAYSAGGGRVSYRVLGDNDIQIIELTHFSSDDEPYFLLDSLPERKASLRPLTCAERRILGSDIRDRSLLDRWRMHRLWNGECFRVSGMLEYYSKLGNGICPSQKNTDGKPCTGWRFAYFPASKRPFGDIWHEYSYDAWFCFAICTDCGTIHAFNECT